MDHGPWMISEVNVLKHSPGVGIGEPVRQSDQTQFICKLTSWWKISPGANSNEQCA